MDEYDEHAKLLRSQTNVSIRHNDLSLLCPPHFACEQAQPLGVLENSRGGSAREQYCDVEEGETHE